MREHSTPFSRIADAYGSMYRVRTVSESVGNPTLVISDDVASECRRVIDGMKRRMTKNGTDGELAYVNIGNMRQICDVLNRYVFGNRLKNFAVVNGGDGDFGCLITHCRTDPKDGLMHSPMEAEGHHEIEFDMEEIYRQSPRFSFFLYVCAHELVHLYDYLYGEYGRVLGKAMTAADVDRAYGTYDIHNGWFLSTLMAIGDALGYEFISDEHGYFYPPLDASFDGDGNRGRREAEFRRREDEMWKSGFDSSKVDWEDFPERDEEYWDGGPLFKSKMAADESVGSVVSSLVSRISSAVSRCIRGIKSVLFRDGEITVTVS